MGYLEDYVRELQEEYDRRSAGRLYKMITDTLKQQKDKSKLVLIPEEDSSVIYFSGENYDPNAESGNSDGGTECVGSYPVSGYTRADGTEVSDYIRTCGAAHLGSSEEDSSDPESSNDAQEDDKEEYSSEDYNEDDYSVSEDGVFNLHASKDEYIGEQDENVVEGVVSTSKNWNKRKISPMSIIQKEITQNLPFEQKMTVQDYYKLALDLAKNPSAVHSNERNRIFKVRKLPKFVNQNLVLKKVAKGYGLDLNNSRALEMAKDAYVVVPRENSNLVKAIQKSDVIQGIIKEDYQNIIDGKYEGKIYDKKVTFERGAIHSLFNHAGRDKFTLFGVLHNVDMFDIKMNSDGSLSFVVLDFYDFEHWEYAKGDGFGRWIVKYINNNAHDQQQKNELKPYVLYIPVRIPVGDLEFVNNGL